MHRPFLISRAVLTSALALGCAEQQSPTEPVSSSPPALSFARSSNGSGGALILRGTLLVGFFFADPDRGLTTVIGIPAARIDSLSFCGGTEEPEPARLLGVVHPSGAVKFLLKNEEASVAVWPFASLDVCGVLAATEPFAEGIARVRSVDNEAVGKEIDGAIVPIGPGANASGIHAQGTVTVVGTGEELSYVANFRAPILPGSSLAHARVLVSDIKLHGGWSRPAYPQALTAAPEGSGDMAGNRSTTFRVSAGQHSPGMAGGEPSHLGVDMVA